MEEVVRVLSETKLSKILLVRSANGSLVVWKETHQDETLKTEVKALRILKNRKDIVQFDQVMNVGNYPFIQMEYIDGKPLDIFLNERKGKLSEDQAREIFTTLALALYYCHQKGVFHRDVKPGNVMISVSKIEKQEQEKFTVKLIDFGVACFGVEESFFDTSRGTEDYAAPEMLLHKPYQASKCDVFSLGMVLYELLIGTIPWDAGTRNKLLKENRHPLVVFPAKTEISEQAKDLVTKMLEPSPGERPFMETVIQHPWLKIEDVESITKKKEKDCCRYTIWKKYEEF